MNPAADSARKRAPFPRLRGFLTSQRQLVRAYFGFRYLRSDPYGSRRRKELLRVNRAFALLDGVEATNALDIGCGEGYEASRLAKVAEHVLAIDISDTAIRRARRLNRSCGKVDFKRVDFLTAPLVAGAYDLVYCSEALYYLELEQLEAARRKIIDLLQPEGRLLLVHHRSFRDETAGTMDKKFGARTIHDVFVGSAELRSEEDVLDPHYRITLLRRQIIPLAVEEKRWASHRDQLRNPPGQGAGEDEAPTE